MPLIEVRSVSKSFRIPDVHRHTIREHLLGVFAKRHFRTLRALDRVDLELRKGEALGIMGHNGSGKSTLLKIICGIYRPEAGSVVLRAPLTPVLELGVGWNPELDAIDNVLLIGSVMGLSLREIRKGMDDILEFAELRDFARLPLKHYSSGMSSRLAYSVAFKAVRDILVLDEIFAVGDAGFRARCEERYWQLRHSGHSVLIVSHDPRTISNFCDRAILLDHGRVVLSAAAGEVAEHYVKALTRAAQPLPEPVPAFA